MVYGSQNVPNPSPYYPSLAGITALPEMQRRMAQQGGSASGMMPGQLPKAPSPAYSMGVPSVSGGQFNAGTTANTQAALGAPLLQSQAQTIPQYAPATATSPFAGASAAPALGANMVASPATFDAQLSQPMSEDAEDNMYKMLSKNEKDHYGFMSQAQKDWLSNYRMKKHLQDITPTNYGPNNEGMAKGIFGINFGTR